MSTKNNLLFYTYFKNKSNFLVHYGDNINQKSFYYRIHNFFNY